MKVEATIFSNSIPEVTKTDKGLRYDFGVLVLELSDIEVESLITNTMLVYGKQHGFLDHIK